MNKEKQLKFKRVQGWGGRRPGAGRPNLSGQVNHMSRPQFGLKMPLHVTLRLRDKLPSIRNKNLFKEFMKSVRNAKKYGLYVIHFSIQSNHIHLFCEAKSNRALALGMRALAGRFAKHVRSHAKVVNSSLAPRGSVFKGRYHLHALKTPSEVKNALEYVLLNLSKHQKLIEYIDPFSSGNHFGEWKRLLRKRFSPLIRWDLDFLEKQEGGTNDREWIEVLSPPQSWLARTGWLRACR